MILYAMVTGHSPFPGSSAATVCFKVVNREPVPASAFDLDLPRGLDAVIARAMAKDLNSRYQRGRTLPPTYSNCNGNINWDRPQPP